MIILVFFYDQISPIGVKDIEKNYYWLTYMVLFPVSDILDLEASTERCFLTLSPS